MLFSSSNTGSTDLRDTEVQQPNTTATLSCVSSCRAFSANSGQFEAGSTTTGSSFIPSTPPLALISSIAISVTSFRTVSLIAIVPDSECNTPTLMVFPCAYTPGDATPAARAALSASALRITLRLDIRFLPYRFTYHWNEPPVTGASPSSAERKSHAIRKRLNREDEPVLQ